MAKQEQIREDFDFGNIVGAKKIIKKEKQKVEQKIALNFSIHKNYILKFYELKQEYAIAKKDYNVSVNKMMKLMILFLENLYKENKILKLAPGDFKKAILKKGKRKRHNRSFKKEDRDLFQVLISENDNEKYLDVMYSFIRNDKGSNEFEDHHTRAYFFYDFVDEIIKYKKEFLEY